MWVIVQALSTSDCNSLFSVPLEMAPLFALYEWRPKEPINAASGGDKAGHKGVAAYCSGSVNTMAGCVWTAVGKEGKEKKGFHPVQQVSPLF
ncbi:unnamed protein product [Arctogadus glacialis]